MLVVSERDGLGISGTMTAPLRIDGDVTELVHALNDIAEHVAGRLAGGAS